MKTSALPRSDRPAEFFQAAFQSFQAAAQQPLHLDYLIGGLRLRLQFANSKLVPAITPALAHLAQVGAGQADLTICLWDSASTGAPMPAAPWSAQDYLARNEIRGYQKTRYLATYNPATAVLNLLDSQTQLALYWIKDWQLLPWYESGAPLLTIFHWWLRQQGCQLLHAAAIGKADGGVLIAGRGGAGKSTTALACLASDLLYASDDYCLLATTPKPHVWSLYSSGKVDRRSLQLLPHLKPAIARPGQTAEEKSLLFLQGTWPEKMVAGFPIRAALLPRLTEKKETFLTPASPAEACKALAPSTLFQLAGADRSTFETVATLVRQVPCYTLHLGTEIAAIPAVITSLFA